MPRIPPRVAVYLAGACLWISVCLGSGAWAPRAAAQLPESIQVSASADELSWPDARAVTLNAQLTAGEDGAAFGLSWAGRLSFSAPSLDGEGEITAFPFPPRPPFAWPASSPRPGLCARRFSRSPSSERYWIELPPAAESTLLVPARLTTAAWPGDDHPISFRTWLERDDSAPPTLLASLPLRVTGASGVRIVVRKARRQPGRPWLWGMSPALIGATKPAAARRRVRLRAIPIRRAPLFLANWRAPGSRPLGAVITDAKGRFRVKPRQLLRKPGGGRARGRHPLRSHGYRVLARIDNPGPGLVADWNCGPRLRPRAPRRP